MSAEGIESIQRDLMQLWAPPPKLRLSQYADEYYYLSSESSAVEGRWKSLPFQVEILDCIGDPEIEQVSCMKSSRVGWTKCLNITSCFYMHYDPCPIMVVQPTIEDAEGYSKEEIDTMIRDVPVLAELFGDSGIAAKGQTILNKRFRGGSLSMVGANSPRGFRRVSRKVILLDEVDGYPLGAGQEGDQIKLAIKRGEGYYDRNVCIGSTPTVDKLSKIQGIFSQGDMRRYHVPCPHCGKFDFLTFGEARKVGMHWHPDDAERGHFMRWPKGRPDKVHFICRECGGEILPMHKFEIIENGKWVARKEFKGHASFAIWTAYSYLPQATWVHIAKEWDEIKTEEQKKTFYNTTAGEPYIEEVQAQDVDVLYSKRERYKIGVVPYRGLILTAGVDVQKNGFYYEVVAWGKRKTSWSVDSGFIPGKVESENEVWDQLEKLRSRSYEHESGILLSIEKMAVDSGAFTSKVYDWCRQKPMTQVIAIKGMPHDSQVMVGNPVKIDYGPKGNRVGYAYWPVFGTLIKREIYSQLGFSIIDGKEPDGYCHFPEYPKSFFEHLTSEALSIVTDKRGNQTALFVVQEGKENHYLDCRQYARAAAYIVGIDRMLDEDWEQLAKNLCISESKEKETDFRTEIEKEDEETEKEIEKQKRWISRSEGFLKRR